MCSSNTAVDEQDRFATHGVLDKDGTRKENLNVVTGQATASNSFHKAGGAYGYNGNVSSQRNNTHRSQLSETADVDDAAETIVSTEMSK